MLPRRLNRPTSIASPCKCHQRRRNASLISSLSLGDELRYYFSAISYQHGLAGPDLTNILAQAVLQIPQAHTLHIQNVA